MTDQTLEFEHISENPGQLVRRYYRIPVEKSDGVHLLIGSTSYPVVDICQEGTGVLCAGNDGFLIGETVSDCRLWLGDKALSGLTGRIIHCSSHVSGQWHFGIQWLNLDAGHRDIMERVLDGLKKKALEPKPVPEQKDMEPGHE